MSAHDRACHWMTGPRINGRPRILLQLTVKGVIRTDSDRQSDHTNFPIGRELGERTENGRGGKRAEINALSCRGNILDTYQRTWFPLLSRKKKSYVNFERLNEGIYILLTKPHFHIIWQNIVRIVRHFLSEDVMEGSDAPIISVTL